MNMGKRLAALEARLAGSEDDAVIIFSEVGAFDGDVAGINYGGDLVDRQPGDSLGALVARARALHPFSRFHVLWFEYSAESKGRRGEFLPTTWPATHHQEAMQ